MAWAKFDDRWATHPKLLAAGLEAKGLDASGICYCAGQETDGFVPDSALVVLAAGHRNARKVAERLVEVGRWHRDDDRKGYVIHDFDVYNFTRAEGEAKRKRDADRKAAARTKQGRDPQGRITSTRTTEEVRVESMRTDGDVRMDSGVSPPLVPPVPTRPDPTPSVVDKSSSSNPSVGGVAVEEEEPSKRATTAVRLLAERRLSARTGPPITNVTAWLRSVQTEIVRDHHDELSALAEQGLHPKAIADRIMPPIKSPYPLAGEPREVAFDEADDERGRLVAVPRRTG